jgi:hypothetical protein
VVSDVPTVVTPGSSSMTITGSVLVEILALFAILWAKVSLLWKHGQSKANEEGNDKNEKSEKIKGMVKDLTLLPPLLRS